MIQPNYYTLTFMTRSARSTRTGEAPIYARITVSGQRAEFNINRNVDPENWNAGKGMAKGRSKRDIELNKYLDSICVRISEIHAQLVKDEEVINPIILKNHFLGNIDGPRMLVETFNGVVAQYKEKLETGDICECTFLRWERCGKYLSEFLSKREEMPDIPIKKLTSGKWNIYSEIKRKLIEDYGIPAHEIRFIQECKTERSRKAVIQAMNDGDVRVLFGSTSMLGTGVNAQRRAVAVHELECPWRPSDLEQREGRAIRAGNEIAKLYADNKVDVIIYAVEKSLDSYKFNLLHCKATFIDQLKSGALGARTIDEGAMDEKNGMNFSEYMAILSGNTDLLEKAKLEKRIAALESERKAHSKGISDSKFRYQTITHDIANNEAAIERMKADAARYESVVKRDKEGNPLNNLTIDTCHLTDEKNMGIHLQGLAQRTDTHGQYQRIGEVYGFPISIISERTVVDGREGIQNRFVVEGNYKYKFNNGFIAMSDTHAACMNFVNALEKIPGIIAQYEECTAKLKADVPQLEAIVAKTWGKEDELKQLKSELAALDRKITAELAPKHHEKDGEEVKQQPKAPRAEVRDNQSLPSGSKESMVAEPRTSYAQDSPSQPRFVASARPVQQLTQPPSFRAGSKF